MNTGCSHCYSHQPFRRWEMRQCAPSSHRHWVVYKHVRFCLPLWDTAKQKIKVHASKGNLRTTQHTIRGWLFRWRGPNSCLPLATLPSPKNIRRPVKNTKDVLKIFRKNLGKSLTTHRCAEKLPRWSPHFSSVDNPSIIQEKIRKLLWPGGCATSLDFSNIYVEILAGWEKRRDSVKRHFRSISINLHVN